MIPQEKLPREAREAINEEIDCWETPDSPEAFCFAMKHLMILRDKIDAILCPNTREFVPSAPTPPAFQKA